MSGESVEVGKIEVNGAEVFSVRIIHNGKVRLVKEHCSTLAEAEEIAKKEAEARGVDVTYGTGYPK